MSFYGGRPGKSFTIRKVFNNYKELYEEMTNSNNQAIELMEVPEGAFVLINYGGIGTDTFNKNKQIEDEWFAANPDVKPNVALGDYNATLWWNMNSPANYNSSVWLKRYDLESQQFYYSYIANIGGIFPRISDTTGNWIILVGDGVGESDTGISAVARQVEFGVEYDRQTGYTLLSQEAEGTIYGLADLNKKYEYNELAGSYDENAEGSFVYMYAADQEGNFQYSEGRRIEIGYTNLNDWHEIETQEISVFATDWLKWRYTNQYDNDGNKIWNDLFEITGLTSVEEFKNEALQAASMAEDYYFRASDIAANIQATKEDIDETAEVLSNKVNEALGYSELAVNASNSVKETVDRFEDIVKDNSVTDTAGAVALAEIKKSQAKFASLDNRLDQMPYQFDTIAKMQACATLSAGDKAFTFGMDNIGDGDSSKLFQIFEPDDEKLSEAVEGTITADNPDGEKIIKEQYPLANGLIAGLLTIFSGYGSGGGSGSAVPSLTVTGSEFTLQENEVIDIEYYWTGPNAGIATLFVTDSNKTSPKVVDYYDNSKVYSSGVQLSGFGSGTISLQPTKGEHNYTIYIIDRAQAYSNEVKVKVTVGGISLKVDLADGKSFTANQAITYNYTVNTIYAKPSVLEYTIYQGNYIFDEGTITSSSSLAGSQSIRLQIKSATQDIGQGEFRVVARAHVEGDESIVTPYITRNFVIMENGVIYLTTSFDGEATPQYQDTPFYIPFELVYNGGSNFLVEGRYSEQADYDWDNGWDKAAVIPPGNFPTPDAAGSFNYTVIMPEVGTYYFKFKVTSTVDDSISGESRVIKTNIIEKISKYPLKREDALQVHYSARRGQTNEANKYIWENISPEVEEYDAVLTNFNYLSNGWEVETAENGLTQPTGYLSCNSKTYVSSTYPFFKNITATQGATFEMVFKSVDIGKDQTILSMSYAQGAGLFIYKDRIVLNVPTWGISNLTAYYNVNGVNSADKPIHVAVTIDPVEKYAKIYIDGVLCRASATMEFNTISNDTTIYFNRGLSEVDPQYSVTKIDCVRFYNDVLTAYEILSNYVYNLRDEVEQTAVYSKNFLDSESEDTIPAEIPYMTFYLTKNEWRQMDKDNVKPKIKVTYHDPNPAEGNNTDYEWEKVTTSWQGTSSIAFPVKNFKIKLPEKYRLRGEKSLEEKTFCLKADYMDSSHCHNTGNANFIHQSGLLTNYSLTPAQSKELGVEVAEGYKGLNNLDLGISADSLKTRTTIDGYPIALYICLETDESEAGETIEKEYEAPIFWGIYNFNLDKGATDSFGLRRDEDDFQNVTSFEVAANSAYDGGGFRAMRFVKNKSTEEYGWTKWNVLYNSTGAVDLANGTLLQINKADGTGAIQEILREINLEDDHIQYQGIYNSNRDLKGLYAPSLRYDANGNQSPSGEYIELFKLDDANDTFVYDENSNKVVEGYYKYIENEWSSQVPKDSIVLSPKTNWEVVDNPQIQDFKYKYYQNDFELRFPDEDIFLTKDNQFNKLYYKEYDKLISLVEWVDNINSDFNFKEEFSQHFNTDTMLNYYLMLMAVGLIDNFGKNLMIDTWGYDKDGNIPYLTTAEGYHKVWKCISEWDADNEYYLDSGEYLYGLMDVDNPIAAENGTLKYNVYASDESYSTKGALLGSYDFGGTDGDRIVGWYHETDISKYIWYPHFYDLDSCLGVNNSGLLSFSPSMEMEDNFYIDYEGNQINNAPFNTSNSALWKQFVDNYFNELKARYLELVTNQIFTLDTFKKYYYTDIIAAMGPRMYNNDAYPKYLSREEIKVVVSGQVTTRVPYTFDHLALGHDWERISSWLSKRLTYLQTMFKKDDVDNTGGFELRSEEPEKEYKLRVECYDPMYMRVVRKNGASTAFRLTGANGVAEFTIPAGGATDQEIYIMPGYNVKLFKEVSSPQLGFSSAKLDNATKLLELDLANSKGLQDIQYERPEGNLIRKINLENCSAFTGVLNARNYPYLEYANTLGTQAVFNFDENGGILEEAYLEAYSDSLVVNNYADLKNLTIQLTYPEGSPSYTEIPLKHNTNFSRISFINCSNPEFNLNIKGRYKNLATQQYEEVALNKFIAEYGKLSLFPLVTSVTLRNSTIDGGKITNQLQPNGDIIGVKELKLSLPLLNRVEVINSDESNIKYDKIAFIYAVRNIDGTNRYVGYPGWGQSPEVTKNAATNEYIYTGDKTFIAGKAEGIIGDKYIKEIEFRAPYLENTYPETILPDAGAHFEFPWRVYLGNLTGLQRLKFNANEIVAKQVSYNANNANGDTYYLTRKVGVTGNTWNPVRFELILPPPTDNGLELIYFAPTASKIEFTCIRQKDTNKGEYIIENNSNVFNYPANWPTAARNCFETVTTGDSSSMIGNTIFHLFRGIDLRGYSNLAMNFKGLTKIKGILGMNALNVPAIDAYFTNDKTSAFSSYFSNCQSLESFFSTAIISEETEDAPAVYDYSQWNFSPWFANNSQYFTDISYFFSNCYALKDSSYLKGLLNQTSKNFAIKTANNLFENCKSLADVTLRWVDNDCLSNIENLFIGCNKLAKADIQITNLDEANKQVKSLKKMFADCGALTEVQVNLLAQDTSTYFKNIETVDYMFQNCGSLEALDLSISNGYTNMYDFDNLISGAYWFSGCSKLKEVKFIDKANFKRVQSLRNAFENCASLLSVFNNSVDNKPQFYDSAVSTEPLEIANLFYGCGALKSLGALDHADFTRATDISNLVSGCEALEAESGIIDFSNIILSDYVKAEGIFTNCKKATEIKLPAIKLSKVNNLFNGCSNLTTLDLSAVVPVRLVNGEEKGLEDFSYMFNKCSKLNNDTFAGYENWDVNYAKNLSYMFAGCSSLKALDFSNWSILKTEGDKSTVTLSHMFESCTALITLKGLNNWFGEYLNVYGNKAGLYNNKSFAANGVDSLFAGCHNLDFSTIDLTAWAKMAINLQYMTRMFENCYLLTDLNKVLGNVLEPYSVMKWGYVDSITPSRNCAFTQLTDLSYLCAGCKKLTKFDYFSTSNGVGYTGMTYSKPTNISSMVNGCSELINFTFDPIEVGMHNVGAIGSALFQNCNKLQVINFLNAGDTGNLGIKVNMDLSNIMTGSTLDYFKANDFVYYLYDFAKRGETPAVSQGRFKVSASQKEYLESANKIAGFVEKGWSVEV